MAIQRIVAMRLESHTKKPLKQHRCDDLVCDWVHLLRHRLQWQKKIVLEVIAESGAKTKKDFGMVMKNVMKRNLHIETKWVKDLATELLDH